MRTSHRIESKNFSDPTDWSSPGAARSLALIALLVSCFFLASLIMSPSPEQLRLADKSLVETPAR